MIFHKLIDQENIPLKLPSFQLNGNIIERENSLKFPGVILDEYLTWKNGSRTIAPEERCPPDNYPRIIAPWVIAIRIIAPWTIAPEDNCHRGKLYPGQLPLRIIAPTQTNSPQKVLRVN